MAAYGPQSVKAMGQAFDEAWLLIAQNFGSPEETEIARLLLAGNTLRGYEGQL